MIKLPPSHPVNHHPAILCVGWRHNDRYLRVEFSGYEWIEVSAEDAPALLEQRIFNLVILAHDVPDISFRKIYMPANDRSKIVQLGQLTPPDDLLLLVSKLLAPRKLAEVISIDRK
jgi:hypothetical protein